MGHEVQYAGVALEVVAEVLLIVDDPLEIVDAGGVVGGAEIKGGDLIIQNEDAMAVDKEVVFGEFLRDGGHHLESFFKGAAHEYLVDLGGGDIDEGLDSEVVVLDHAVGPRKVFEFAQDAIEPLVVAEIEVGVQQVVKRFDIVAGLHADHDGLFFEEVEPFLGIAVVHEEILADEGVPVIALVEVEAFVEPGLLQRVGGKLFAEVFAEAGFIFFVAGVAVFDVPAIDQQGEVGEAGDHVDAAEDFDGFGGELFGAHLHAMGDMERLDPLLQRQDLDEEVKFLVGFCGILGPVEEAEALLEQAFFVEDMGVVEHFVELEVNAVGAFEEAEAGEDLFVQVCFEVGQLGLLDAREFFQQVPFVIVVEFIECVEQLDDLEVFFGGTAFDV